LTIRLYYCIFFSTLLERYTNTKYFLTMRFIGQFYVIIQKEVAYFSINKKST